MTKPDLSPEEHLDKLAATESGLIATIRALLDPLAVQMRAAEYPPELRAFMWEAVGLTALRYAKAAAKERG